MVLARQQFRILYNYALMQTHAYDAMQVMQERHWWWQGMRYLYRSVLVRFARTDPEHVRVRRALDIGCGFGSNLPVLNPIGDVVGLDISLDALRAISCRPALGLVQAYADALPFRAQAFDVVALLAVVEHVDHDDRVLSESYRVARRGAIQILLTSAFMQLWSRHDVANNHRRRYRAAELDGVQRNAGWHILTTSYVNAFIFPVAALIRSIQRLVIRPQPGDDRASTYDMGPDIGLFSSLLRAVLDGEAWLIVHGVRLPVGVDLFSVSRRD